MIIMSGPDWKRLWMHVPCGLLGAILLWLNTGIGAVYNFSFLVYQIAQDWRIGDKGFKDILGHVVGLAIGGVIWLILKWIGVL